MKQTIKNLIEKIKVLSLEDKIEAINEIKIELHKISPFKSEPVDCVLWVKNDNQKGRKGLIQRFFHSHKKNVILG